MKNTHRQARSPLVLIAEDEGDIADILSAYLGRSGLRSARAVDGESALALHRQLRPDLVLLDVQMPKLDGWQVLTELRRRGNTPVIMLTALDQDVDKLTGLRVGADDYVVKPFNPAEVIARVQAVLRRSAAAEIGDTGSPTDVIRQGPLDIDLLSHEVFVRDHQPQRVPELTYTEFRLLAHLARAPRQVHSRISLLHACLPEGETQERTIDSHVSKLRRKLESVGINGIPATVRGVGYRFLE
ncbi:MULTISPECIES: response regulator [Stenotrophomonas]|uniref:response regulator n=1 Tax=Stenotrophomonas TaxID=40323 RepID=UPI000786C6E4|nr:MULTISPECIES: response regulator [Stenotrophomonas]KYK41018.1 two-component system response regulator [Stenotrophomonas maltophilia]MDQ7313769.1 response regulator [Stenotrophomonas sp. Sm8]